MPPAEASSAVGYVSGAIDLIYRDPEDGRLVVADYKTDRVDSVEAIAQRALHHAPQGAAYVDAVRQALDLAEPPRIELWFLWPCVIWRP